MSCVIARETGDERGASLAQSVERFTRNEKVISSILIGSSVENPWKSKDFQGFSLFCVSSATHTLTVRCLRNSLWQRVDRHKPLPLGGALIGMGDREHCGIGVFRSHNVQANGLPADEATGNTDPRHTGQVCS